MVGLFLAPVLKDARRFLGRGIQRLWVGQHALRVQDGRDLLLHAAVTPGGDDAVHARRLDLRDLGEIAVGDRYGRHRLEDLVAGVVGQHRRLWVLHEAGDGLEAVEAGGRRAVASDAGDRVEAAVV